jgi:hypothetical protein
VDLDGKSFIATTDMPASLVIRVSGVYVTSDGNDRNYMYLVAFLLTGTGEFEMAVLVGEAGCKDPRGAQGSTVHGPRSTAGHMPALTDPCL